MTKKIAGFSSAKDAASTIMIVFLILVTIILGVKIYQTIAEYRINREKYRELSESVTRSEGNSLRDSFTVDFDKLRRTNPDVVGWIRCKGTVIDYPIVQGNDNTKYLRTMFDGSYGICGTLFVDAAATDPFDQFNTIVYGHHMKDGSMFGSLKKFRELSYCRKHPKMVLATPEGSFDLQIWAFLNQPSDSLVFTNNVEGYEEKNAYIEWIRNKVEYTTDVEVDISDQIVVLSTCAYEYAGARYIVVCKKLK